MGALLAILVRSHPKDVAQRYLRKIALPVGLVASGLLLFLSAYPVYWKISTIFYDFSLALFFCWLIHSASLGFSGVAVVILESRSLTYVGKISYGIYVYHPFMPKLCIFIFGVIGYSFPQSGLIAFILPTALTLIVASLSWRVMEKPINSLKRYFEYRRDAPDKEELLPIMVPSPIIIRSVGQEQ